MSRTALSGDSNVSFHVIYEETGRICRELPIYIMFQTLSVFLEFEKGEQMKQGDQCTKRWKEAQKQVSLILAITTYIYMLSSALVRHMAAVQFLNGRHFY